MKLPSFKQVQFLKSAVKVGDYPNPKNPKGELLLEIAVAGKSNVGKSSLLNDLFRRKSLVKTSAIPGKTQLINFFTVDDQLCFVDLPGYGFAQVPIAVRRRWGPMIQTYLDSRKTLSLILFLFDIRRLPNEDDLQLMQWITFRKLPTILVMTKIDKVTTSEKQRQAKKILEKFDCPDLPYTYYSTLKHIGRHELVILMDRVLNPA